MELPKENPQDIVKVHNPMKEDFPVSYDRVPHLIKAGQDRLMPRYLANHWAKHAADKILTDREFPVNDVKRRPIILAKILVGVQQYFSPTAIVREGEKLAQQVGQLNEPEAKPFDAGEVETPLIKPGTDEVVSDDEFEKTLEPDKKTKVEKKVEKVLEKEPKSMDEYIDKMSTQELQKEAEELGIEVTGKETKRELVKAIKDF